MLSGPISFTEYSWRGVIVRLLADEHNSREGNCRANCSTHLDDGSIKRTSSGCVELPLYLHDLLTSDSSVNFMLEYAYCLSDRPLRPERQSGLDYIDAIAQVMSSSLTREKNGPYLPNLVHYTDIRTARVDDVHGEFTANLGCNPFSGVWIANYIAREPQVDVETLIAAVGSILDHADVIADIFLSTRGDCAEKLQAIDTSNRLLHSKWLPVLANVSLVFSEIDGVIMHRVAKQLHKLEASDREIVESWTRRRFSEELENAEQSFSHWAGVLRQGGMPTGEESVCITIALSSVMVDCYAIARMIYHLAELNVFFAGDAHIDNYKDFFSAEGEVTEQKENVGRRCLI